MSTFYEKNVIKVSKKIVGKFIVDTNAENSANKETSDYQPIIGVHHKNYTMHSKYASQLSLLVLFFCVGHSSIHFSSSA